MAIRTTSTPRRSRALPAGALIALCLLGPGAVAQTVGPVANFGPSSFDLRNEVQADAAPVDAQDVRDAQPAAQDPESKPLMAPRSVTPAAVEGAAPVEQPGAASWTRVVGALAVVIGLILLTRSVVKRVASKSGLRGQFGAGGRAPAGVLEVLGRYPISRGQSLVLLRVDQRVLLLSQSGGGFCTLANFDDPSEVASLLMKSRDDESESLSGRFKQMLSAFERDPAMTRGVEHVDLTRRAPLVHRAAAIARPQQSARRVATPAAAQDAIRQRLASLGEAVG